MIEIARLEKMVQAEVAADKWWHDMSDREKKAYLKAHPKSKYGKFGPDVVDSHRATMSHEKAIKFHNTRAGRHDVKAINYWDNGRGDFSRNARAHEAARDMHEKAARAHAAALENHEEVLNSAYNGERFSIDRSRAGRSTRAAQKATQKALAASKALAGKKTVKEKPKKRRAPSSSRLRDLFGDHFKG